MNMKTTLSSGLSLFTTRGNTLLSSAVVAFVSLFAFYRMGGIARLLPFDRAFFLPVFFMACFPLMVLLPLGTLPLMKGAERFGLGFGRWRMWSRDVAILYGISLLIIFPAVRWELLGDAYPLWKRASQSLGSFLFYEGAHFVFLFSGEFLFRGFYLFSLRPDTGGAAAVCLQMVPYAVLHAGKPEPEAYASILGGLILGMLAVRGRSVWPCVFLHFLIALTVDVLEVWS